MSEHPGAAYARFQGKVAHVFPRSDVFGWRDIIGQVLVRGVGANDPTWSQVGAGPLSAYAFSVNDECWFAYHIPHDYAPETGLFFHAHWMSDGIDTNSVKWEWVYSYARGFDQGNYDADGEATLTAEEAPPGGLAYRGMTTETAKFSPSVDLEPDGIIYTRLRRITNGAVDNTDTIFLLTADVHYQSTDRSTIAKRPDFYSEPA